MLVPESIVVARRAKAANGFAASHGDAATEQLEQPSSGIKRKRAVDEGDLDAENIRKRGKVPEQTNGDAAIEVDDNEEGAIVLE